MLAGMAEGPNALITMYNPRGVAVTSLGTLFIADTGNNAIRMVINALLRTGFVAHRNKCRLALLASCPLWREKSLLASLVMEGLGQQHV